MLSPVKMMLQKKIHTHTHTTFKNECFKLRKMQISTNKAINNGLSLFPFIEYRVKMWMTHINNTYNAFN